MGFESLGWLANGAGYDEDNSYSGGSAAAVSCICHGVVAAAMATMAAAPWARLRRLGGDDFGSGGAEADLMAALGRPAQRERRQRSGHEHEGRCNGS